MYLDIQVRQFRDAVVKVSGIGSPGVRRHLAEAVEDIADAIEAAAIARAPDDKDPDAYTWRPRPGPPLKAHPVDRDSHYEHIPSRFTPGRQGGFVDVRNPLFGGGFAIRGKRGFVPGVGRTPGEIIPDIPEIYEPGRTIAEEELRVTDNPFYAIYVHEGTSGHGPVTAQFMKYRSFGKQHRRKWVAGQEAQPYLTDAYYFINGTYAPERVARLRIRLGL